LDLFSGSFYLIFDPTGSLREFSNNYAKKIINNANYPFTNDKMRFIIRTVIRKEQRDKRHPGGRTRGTSHHGKTTKRIATGNKNPSECSGGGVKRKRGAREL